MTQQHPGFVPPQPPPPFGPPAPTFSVAPRPRRRWLPWVIIGGVVFLVLLGTVLVASITTIVGAAQGTQGDPLVPGEPGPTTAQKPLECPTSCFVSDDIAQTIIDPFTLDAIGGLNVSLYDWGTYDPSTAGQLHRSNIPGWANMEGSPDACFFAPGNSPASFYDSDDSMDEIQWTGTETTVDKTSTFDQSTRLFPGTAGATAYMADLADQISRCNIISVGSGRDLYTATITPAPQLSVPDSVAAVGWVRTGDRGPRWRAYVFDLQRGNLVVRTRLITDGSISEKDFRDAVTAVSQQLYVMEPATAATQ